MLAQLQRYWLAAILLVAGAILILVIGLTAEDTTAIAWAGGVIGVLVGIAIAATSRSEDPGRAAQRKKRRR